MTRVQQVGRFRIGLLLSAVLLGAAVMIQRIASAQGSREPNFAALEKRLNQVLANQQTILQKLDAMMEELRIIKVRATR